MIPKYCQGEVLEKMAASKEPSLEGSWWIMLQTTEHILNHAAMRDPVNNKILETFWGSFATNLIPWLDKEQTRPLPYDELMQLVDYCGDQLKHILNDPRHKIVKVDKMVLPHRMKYTTSKTMKWLGKQPGTTVKEKICTKNRLLTQVSEYSYDTKENQVTVSVLKQLSKKIQGRLEYGINDDGYDQQTDEVLEKLLKLKKRYKNSYLSDVEPVKHTQPNNVLLGDKDYLVIWRAYQVMAKYEGHLKERWKQAFERYIECLYLALVAHLQSFSDLIMIEERIKVDETDGQLRFVDHSENTVQKTSFLFNCEGSKPVSITIKKQDQVISLSIDNVPINNKRLQTSTSRKMSYKIDLLGNKYTQYKRGMPIVILAEEDKAKRKVESFCDMAGINSFIKKIEETLQTSLDQQFTKVANDNTIYYGTCTYDAVSTKPYWAVENTNVWDDISNYVVEYTDNKDLSSMYTTKPRKCYLGATQYYYVADMFSEKNRMEALEQALDSIASKLVLQKDDYFIYTVPDLLDEFSQRALKQCVNARFKSTFPVWRSVAAVTDIIETDNQSLKQDEVFLVIDLSMDTATAGIISISTDYKIKQFICNHYPPLPEEESGDFITEMYFSRSYLDAYLQKIGVKLHESVKERILKSGKLQQVFNAHLPTNEIINNQGQVGIIRIEYDKQLFDECVRKWQSHYERFLRDIQKNLPSGKIIQYTVLITDIGLTGIKEWLDKRIQNLLDYVGSYLVTSASIVNGAYCYRDRIIKHHPTWTEYLPKLSLEVIKDGRYATLDLISDDIAYDVMGEKNESVVKEKLLLKAGENEYCFPLVKEDINRKSIPLEAYIKHPSFPLKQDVEVELTVRYKYGYENSYEIILKPYGRDQAIFDEIVIEWKQNNTKEVEDIWPGKNQTMDEAFVQRTIEQVQDSLMKIEKNMVINMINCFGDPNKEKTIKMTQNFLFRNIFKIRNIMVSKSESSKVFVNWFINTSIYHYLAQFAGIYENEDISEVFLEVNKGKELNALRQECMRVLFSLGNYTPQNIQDYFLEHYDRFEVRIRMKAVVDMLLLNYDNTEAINRMIEDVRCNRKMEYCISELSKMCCFDSDLIYAIYEQDSKFIVEVVSYIIKALARMQNKYKKGIEKPSRQEEKQYISYLEMILAILRLRDTERVADFRLLKVNTPRALRLAKCIRSIDSYVGLTKSGVRLSVDKPEELKNMSNLAYAINLFLTGDKKATSIQVVSVDEE